ncbi:hypothetical protein EV663_101664 [Rhodovulum bhavnagarense]|uniref:Uncharacterized protein n=1 Tax=Rhodovulum bhavnagarense TaxID=992286 RepID=A0A4R2RW86_9RHOB|nr:hypothetical protein [Rhodovulum bhavnagarense]TCP63395.1 hypothetical protein EV663_101664 [Rhodovulum bhavnagarense]
MQYIQHTVRGLTLLFDINWDRMLFPVAIALALLVAAFLGSL